MRGHYDRFGKLCTQITEANRTFIVDKSPLEVLNDSIRGIGFDLRGALETSKYLLGDVHMCPIMVNPIHQIVLFPTRSPKHEDTIWLNPYPIRRTASNNRKTLITFHNNTTLIVPLRLASFNTKLKTAEQLRDMTVELANKPFTFVLHPDKRSRIKDKR